jgi:hypothetical protein
MPQKGRRIQQKVVSGMAMRPARVGVPFYLKSRF